MCNVDCCKKNVQEKVKFTIIFTFLKQPKQRDMHLHGEHFMTGREFVPHHCTVCHIAQECRT